MLRENLFEQIGGEDGVNKIVDLFYKKMLADERINKIFEDIYLPILIAHQRAFLKFALGGANEYKGKPLREAHAKLVKKKGLNNYHFDSVAEILKESIYEAGIEEATCNKIMEYIESTRKEVLNL